MFIFHALEKETRALAKISGNSLRNHGLMALPALAAHTEVLFSMVELEAVP